MSEPDSKKFWFAKTFWVNLLAIICLIVQSRTSFVISPETQVAMLAGLNIVLRAVTKTEISW